MTDDRILPRTLIALWVPLAFATGCSKPSASSAATKPTDVGPTYTGPTGASPATIDSVEYAYVASAERETQIVSGFPKLKVGQSREEVRDVLGAPDTAQPGYSKEYSSRFLGWSSASCGCGLGGKGSAARMRRTMAKGPGSACSSAGAAALVPSSTLSTAGREGEGNFREQAGAPACERRRSRSRKRRPLCVSGPPIAHSHH